MNTIRIAISTTIILIIIASLDFLEGNLLKSVSLKLDLIA